MATRSHANKHSEQRCKTRQSRRQLLVQSLERRELLFGDVPLPMPVWAPGTPQSQVDDYFNSNAQGSGGTGPSSPILSGTRWSNPVGGPSPNAGDPSTVTWSIVPDGTTTPEGGQASDLIAFMDGIYGNGNTTVVADKPWFPLIARAYGLWSETAGISFVYEPNDDGAVMNDAARGVSGIRGDIRISGAGIDGNSGILAYNFLPSGGGNSGFDGDMVIDTTDNFYSNNSDGPNGENRGLVNVAAHEAGHGIGILHVIPVDGTKLMEPFINFGFYGPQLDDIINSNELYGDKYEFEEQTSGFIDLGTVSNGTRGVFDLSIDNSIDSDLFRFEVGGPRRLGVIANPVGAVYDAGPQGGAATTIDTTTFSNLRIRVLDSDGSTVLSSSDVSGLGSPEIISDVILPTGGTYFVEVSGTGTLTQLYEMQLQLEGLLDVDPADTAPRLISINPNAGEIFDLDQNNFLTVSPTELTFRFDGSQRLDADTLEGIRITRSGGDGTFGDGNEEIVVPGFLGFGESERIVISRFANPLVDDQYKIEIFGFDLPGAGITGLRNVDGQLFLPEDINADREEVLFEIELGALVTAVVPQPVETVGGVRQQLGNVIHVYFNDDPLSAPANGKVVTGAPGAPAVVNPDFYNLFFTNNTVENIDDAVLNPVSIEYDPAINRAVLTFPTDLWDWAPVVAAGGGGTLRLRVGSSEALPSAPIELMVPGDESIAGAPGDLFASAMPLGSDFDGAGKSVVISSDIAPVEEYLIEWPGSNDEPGVRTIRRNSSLVARADVDTGIETLFYNFKTQYGEDTQGNRLNNAITEAQKQRTREVLALYEQYLGVRFVESEDRGLHIVTGDMRAVETNADVEAGGNLSIYRSSDSDPGIGLLILDGAENWYDGYGQSPDGRPSWFEEALRQIGSLLGIGDRFDLAPGTAAGSEPQLSFGLRTEPDYLSQTDITLGQHLFRPESRDVDLYRFNVSEPGRLTAETFAERLANSSLLDTSLTLWRNDGGEYQLIARNDDFYSNDSFIGIDLTTAGEYVIGVSASGNDNYNPLYEGSGLGGRSEGQYQLRLVYQAAVANSITDTSGTPLDGDADGIAGGDYNFWFRVAQPYDGTVPNSTVTPPAAPRTLFVDKSGSDASASNGTLTSPLRTIDQAMLYAYPGDIIRLLPNAGADNRFDTLGDNRAYEIGRGGVGNVELSDGLNLEIRRGVTVMIDSGAILKLRGAQISVGSSSIDTDRSLSALQVLGTPIMVSPDGSAMTTPTGERISGQVIFTSYDDQNVGLDTNPLQTTPSAGQWGGLRFRNDVDYAQGRPVEELEGTFVNYVGQADIRFGGGAVGSAAVAPIQMNEARPAIKYTIIRNSADAAMSADPNSFEETNFHSPQFQRAASFTSDYDRVGPDLAGNQFVNNSINGLFIRIDTPSAGELEPMSVSGRFDDANVTHVLSQQLIVQGTPGGPILQTQLPSVLSVNVVGATPAVPTVFAAGTYNYRMTFVDIDGSESLASLPTRDATITAGQEIRLSAIPAAPTGFVGRRIYRLDPSSGEYHFVTQLNKSQQTFTDRGLTRGGVLDVSLTESFRPRYDARLSIDPGIVIKVQTARIETTFGADFYAEGLDGRPVVFTSRQDDRYGAGGNFDTNNDGLIEDGGNAPVPGDWAGLVFRQGSSASVDHALITFAGGNALVEGGFANFNPMEIIQAQVRVSNSTFEDNAGGLDSDPVRAGRGFNEAASIFVRGAQPVIIANSFIDNEGAAISINPDSLNFYNVTDWGRGTGSVDAAIGFHDNQGPLIRNNRLTGNDINGLAIRPEVLTTESVWDDTDIVHAVMGKVYTVDYSYVGGLRLESSPSQSLVVKFDTDGELVATGRPLDIDDRIGGSLQVVGQPGFPVILTSLWDDSVGAGFAPNGRAQTDTNGGPGLPRPGDWQGLTLDVFANDRNVQIVLENEPALATDAEFNAIPGNSQFIGSLAASEKTGDENERLGFDVQGTISTNSDLDVYSFIAEGGTEVWIDLDRTTYSLDSVVELIDQNGNILVLSDDTFTEASNPSTIFRSIEIGDLASSLNKTGVGQVESPNDRDAGFRVVLPGAAGEDALYFVRVRSSNLADGDPATKLLDSNLVRDGLSSGAYRLGIRLREVDEVAGSTVQFADIRYAVNGIDLVSAPLHSPLVGEAAEALTLVNGVFVDQNHSTVGTTLPLAEPLGNLLSTDRGAISITGRIGNQDITLNPATLPELDVDVFEFSVVYDSLETEIFRPDIRHVPVTFDIDYADGLGRVNTSISVYDAQGRLILTGRDSNIAGDVGTPLRGVDSENLSAGSAGKLDAHIGPVELLEGTYFVAVHSDVVLPAIYDQFIDINSPNPLVRVLPINSVRTIASDPLDDHLVPPIFPLPNEQFLDYTADRPLLEPAFDTDAIVPYTLEDVNLFVAFAGGIGGGTERTTIAILDPYTGTFKRTIGETGPAVGDLAIRGDGELYAYSTAPQTGAANNASIGNYLNISSQTGTVLSSQDDGITFRRNNAAGDGTEADDNAQLIINAMAFNRADRSISDADRVFVVGTRDTFGRAGEVLWGQNVLYANVATTGATTNAGSTSAPDRDFGTGPIIEPFGPASQKFELGVIDTGIYGTNAGPGGTITGIVIDPFSPQFIYSVDSLGGVYLTDLNGPLTTVDLTGFIGGSYNRVLSTQFLGRITADPTHTLGDLNFSGLSLGPIATEGGRYAQSLFATTADGWIYGIEVDQTQVVPVANKAGLFVNGQSAIQIRTVTGAPLGRSPVGLAFSTLESNPWHQTNDRGTDPGHGIIETHDLSRPNFLGGSSLYFGFEPTGNVADNTLEFPEANAGTLAPGGSHGKLQTQPFSLEGYSESDKPTLYFSYFLETEGVNFIPGSTLMRDSFRVYGAGDDGAWRLLSTNDSFRDPARPDEFDEYFFNGATPVQETFDNTNSWRQARIDISPLAGNEQVRLRFDFSTAGAMNHPVIGFRTEVQAVAGEDLRDGDLLTIQDSLDPFAPPTILEVDLGFVLDFPSGNEITLGDSFDVTVGATTERITFVAGTVSTLGQAAITAEMTSSQVADQVLAALPANVNGVRFGAASVGLTDADIVINNAATSGVVMSSTPGISATSDEAIIVEGSLSIDEVAQRLQEAFARAFGSNLVTPDNYKVFAGRVVLYQQTVIDGGPFGFSLYTPGDEFGAFASASFTAVNSAPGQNNEVEGLYIDDFVIGFAERGEMVLNAPVNTTYIVNPESDRFGIQPERPDEILTGGYSLEIRTSAQFGVPNDFANLPMWLNEDIGLGRSFDTNDRLDSATTLVIPSGGDIRDGDTFTLSDGTRQMTFEFDSVFSPGVASNRVPVSFDPRTFRDVEVAAAVRDAINSQQVQLVLDIRANSGDSLTTGPTTSNRVELFGETIFVNPSVGRNLKIDMVAEENFRDRVAAQTIPQIAVDDAPVEYILEPDTLARALPTEYLDGSTDTLVATGKIGDRATSGNAGEVISFDDPRNDVDILKIHLFAENIIDVDLDALSTTLAANLLDAPLLEIYGSDGTLLATSLDVGQSATAPGESLAEAFIRFTAPTSDHYFVAVRSALDPITDLPLSFGEYQLIVRPASDANDVIYVDQHLDKGDLNRFREQGQILIQSNFISDSLQWGIRAVAGDRDQTGLSTLASTALPRPGSVRLLRNENSSRLIPGSVISNNVIISGGSGGILFAGDPLSNGVVAGPVPFGRIVNNTVVGSPASGDIGIDVGANASPTVINNIVSGFDTGLRVAAHAASQTTIVGGNIYRDNTTASNFALGNSSFNLDLPQFPIKALFTDAPSRIYIPASGSLAIDSSFASVQDRQQFFGTVKQPSGLGISPIIAPSIDAYGQPRVDDPLVQTPAGVGANVFIDRGALDRADFAGPIASIAVPTDFVITQGGRTVDGDSDGTETFLRLPIGTLEFFELQLLEPQGSGPNTVTVLSEAVVLTENGRRMIEGVDYIFGYSASSNTIRLTPLSGIWRPDAAYEITLNNRDRLVAQAPAGDGVNDGEQVIVTDEIGTRAFLEYETGYVLSVPQTLTLVIPVGEGGNDGFRDGDQFEIRSPDGTVERFELNVFGDIGSGVIEVPIAPGSTASAIRDAILAVLETRTGTLDIAPVAIGSNQIQLGSLAGHFVDPLVSPLAVIGINRGVSDGDTLRYRSGTTELQFEFDLDTDGNVMPETNVVISFSRRDTFLQLAEKLATAFRNTDFDLSDPRALGDGRVHLGGLVGDQLLTDGTSVTQQGVPGVTDSLTLQITTDASGFAEGDQFAIVRDGTPTIFELTFDRDVQLDAEPVTLLPSDSAEQVAQKIVEAIINANLGITPTSEGGGLIRLNESFGYELDLLGFAFDPTTAAITSAGVPAGAVAVPIVPAPSLTPDGVAAQLVAAIRRTPLVSQMFTPGGGSIWFSNTRDVSGLDITNVGAIQDLAGNNLQPNRANSETQFTILMPNVELDFGDAPDSYNTLTASNGARATLGNRDVPRLGLLIDSEADGQIGISDDAGDLNVTVGGSAGALGPIGASVDRINEFTSLISTPSLADEGAQLVLQSAGRTFVYELDSDGVLADSSFFAVEFVAGMDANDLAAEIARVVNRTTASRLAARAEGDLLLVYGGDEDGVPVGQFAAAGRPPVDGLFYDFDGSFLSFLNPLDGAVDVEVFTIGGGLLDVWVDFDQDGTWNQAGEHVLISQPVLDGRNQVQISTPIDAIDGLTWARFRLSRTGNQDRDGVAIAGEVEDYQVRVASVQPPQLVDDSVVTIEDTTLVVPGVYNNVLDNDQLNDLDPATIQVQLEDDVRFGTLTLSNNGDFTYVPDANYYGTDTFTYRIFGLAELVPGNPAAGLLPVRSTQLGTVTITVNPVNDVPLVVDKGRSVLEDDALSLRMTAAELLVGATPADLGVVTESPWDESDQSIRVTAIGDGTTSVTAPSGVGVETASITTLQGITVTANFVDGALVDLVYQASNNYNFNNPANPAATLPSLDFFTFTVTDDGRTVYLDGTEIAPLPERSTIGTVVVTVDPVNDPPEFDLIAQQTFLEDSGPITVLAADNLLPGPANALDELGQTVTFTLIADPANPASLFEVAPTIDANGILRFTTALHQTGTAIFTVTAMDDGPNDSAIGDDPIADSVQLTITIDPVNDPPEFVGASPIDVLEDEGPFLVQYASDIQAGPDGATDESGQSLAFIVTTDPANPNPPNLIVGTPTINSAGQLSFTSVANSVGTATYLIRLRDNGGTANGGIDASPFQTLTINVRPVNDAPSGSLIENPLRTLEDTALDIPAADLLAGFVVGPNNEADNSPGGGQTLSIVDFGTIRTANGQVTAITNGNGVVTSLRYVPDLNFNSGANESIRDALFFSIADDGVTFNLLSMSEEPDPLAISAQLDIIVEPVNDEPTFSALTTSIRRLEDSGSVAITGWATNIATGPPTAGDETNPVTGQSITFSVTPAPGQSVAAYNALFADSGAPTVSPNGTLSFVTAPNAVGTVVAVIAAVDSGANDPIRGDDNTSRPVTVTFTLAPVNDAPIANPGMIEYELDEDRSIQIPLTNGFNGLYDIFTVGPDNEADSSPGGSQVITTDASLYPLSTFGGGTIEPYMEQGVFAGLLYRPAPDFNGTDSFVYGVRDNGQTFNLSTGQLFSDPLESYATVSLIVNAVNDRPQFSGGVDVSVPEDNGSEDPQVPASAVGISMLDNWATNVLAGPATATDEISGVTAQQLAFEIEYLSGTDPADLFEERPTVDPATGQLRFKTLPNANGTTNFQVVLVDNGPTGFLEGDSSRPENLNRSVVREFAIEVTPVNDRPTFTAGINPVVVDEDSGPTSRLWATDILPGPADEVASGQAVLFDVVVPAADQAKFLVQPTISDTGILRLTPADNAFGDVVVSITAQDTLGATSTPPVQLTISITPFNDAPVAVADEVSGGEDAALSIDAATLLANDIDVDLPNDSTSISTISAVSLQGAAVTISADGLTITYDPTVSQALQALRPGEIALDQFEYQIEDESGAVSEPATVTVRVSGSNDAPVAVADSVFVSSSSPTAFNPLANDTDVDGTINSSTLLVTLQPAFGSLTVNPTTGLMTYTPFASFAGSDLIRYVVRDDLGVVSNQANIVIGVNDRPLANNDFVLTYRNEGVTFNPLANDIDADSGLDLSSINITQTPSRGLVVVNDDGTLTYQPNNNFDGNDSFTYTVTDNDGSVSNPATVQVQVVGSRLQNPQNNLDVNASGQVSPIDALLIINHLNRGGSTNIDDLLPGPPYLDVNGSGSITPIDALQVINALNRGDGDLGQGEGEGNDVGLAFAPPRSAASFAEIGQQSFFDFGGQPSGFAAGGGQDATKLGCSPWEHVAQELDEPIDSILDSLIAAEPSENHTDLDAVWSEFGE